MKLMRAPWMTFARPGTDSDTKLRIVRKDMSLIVPQTYCINHDIAKFRHIFHIVVSSKNLIPSSKYEPIYAEISEIYGGRYPSRVV